MSEKHQVVLKEGYFFALNFFNIKHIFKSELNDSWWVIHVSYSSLRLTCWCKSYAVLVFSGSVGNSFTLARLPEPIINKLECMIIINKCTACSSLVCITIPTCTLFKICWSIENSDREAMFFLLWKKKSIAYIGCKKTPENIFIMVYCWLWQKYCWYGVKH